MGSRLCQRHYLRLCTSDPWGVFLIKLHISDTEQKSRGALCHETYLLKAAEQLLNFVCFNKTSNRHIITAMCLHIKKMAVGWRATQWKDFSEGSGQQPKPREI